MSKTKNFFGGLGEILKTAGALGINTGKAYGKLLKTCYWDIPKAGVQIFDAYKGLKDYNPSIEDLEKAFGKDLDVGELYEKIQEAKDKELDRRWKWLEKAWANKMYEAQLNLYGEQVKNQQTYAEASHWSAKYWKDVAQEEAKKREYRPAGEQN